MQLGQRAQVAGVQGLLGNLLLAAKNIDTGALFRLVLVDVVKRGGAGQRAGENAEQAQLAHEGVGDGLVNERGEGLVVLAYALLRFARAGVEAVVLNAVVRGGRQVFGHQIHHAGNANAGQRGDGAHGNNARRPSCPSGSPCRISS